MKATKNTREKLKVLLEQRDAVVGSGTVLVQLLDADGEVLDQQEAKVDVKLRESLFGDTTVACYEFRDGPVRFPNTVKTVVGGSITVLDNDGDPLMFLNLKSDDVFLLDSSPDVDGETIVVRLS